MLQTLKTTVESDCDVMKPNPAILNAHYMLICRWNCSFTESSRWQIDVPWLVFLAIPKPPPGSSHLLHPLPDGGDFLVEECLNVRPDLVGFCPRECLKHAFTPGREHGATPSIKGPAHPKIELIITILKAAVYPSCDLTGRIPRPALSEFHRISASVWPSLESHRPSGAEAPLWYRPIPAVQKN